MSDRGMKKWNAYKALVEQYEALDKNMNGRIIHEKPVLSVDKEEEINDLLVNYHGQEVVIKYFHNKKPCSIQGTIVKIDANERRLYMSDGKSILLEELTDIVNATR